MYLFTPPEIYPGGFKIIIYDYLDECESSPQSPLVTTPMRLYSHLQVSPVVENQDRSMGSLAATLNKWNSEKVLSLTLLS